MGEKNLPAKAEELLTEVMNKDPLVLASISAVPYFGSTLATFFSAKWLQVYQERTDSLFRRFGEHLSTLDEQTIKRDYFDTPEGIDLLIKATEQSTKTRSEEKRDLLARILRGAVIDYEQGTYSPEEYLNLISDLTVQELRVARLLYKERPETEDEPWKQWEERACATVGMERSDLHLALGRLGNTGLLQQVSGGRDEDGIWLAFPKYGESSYYRVTQIFDRLMEFLTLHPRSRS